MQKVLQVFLTSDDLQRIIWDELESQVGGNLDAYDEITVRIEGTDITVSRKPKCNHPVTQDLNVLT